MVYRWKFYHNLQVYLCGEVKRVTNIEYRTMKCSLPAEEAPVRPAYSALPLAECPSPRTPGPPAAPACGMSGGSLIPAGGHGAAPAAARAGVPPAGTWSGLLRSKGGRAPPTPERRQSVFQVRACFPLCFYTPCMGGGVDKERPPFPRTPGT